MKQDSFIDFCKILGDEEACARYLESIIWNGTPICPHCGKHNPYKTKVGWKCSDNTCYKKFTIRNNSIFHNSKLPFTKWLFGIYLFVNDKRGFSSDQLKSILLISKDAAWYMSQRIREMMKNADDFEFKPNTVVEVDEMYIGGIDRFKHKKKMRKKTPKGQPASPYTNEGKLYLSDRCVIGIKERAGRVKMKYIKTADGPNCKSFIEEHVTTGSTVYTDSSTVYIGLNLMGYLHDKVNHSNKQYVKGSVHTQSIESEWSHSKSPFKCTYNYVKERHFQRYIDEFAARLNTKKMNAMERMRYFLKYADCYISFKELRPG